MTAPGAAPTSGSNGLIVYADQDEMRFHPGVFALPGGSFGGDKSVRDEVRLGTAGAWALRFNQWRDGAFCGYGAKWAGAALLEVRAMTLYVAYDSDRIIRRLRDSQTAIDTLAAADATLTAHTGGFADTTLIDVGWYLGTDNVPTAVLPASLLWAEEQKALKRSVAQAFRTYEHGQAPGSRQASWPNRAADAAIANDALLATDRWVLHQVAIADRVIDRLCLRR